jgi:hypothetical protein
MNIEPTLQELQTPHHCCQCGARMLPGEVVRCKTISILKGGIISGHRIAWCFDCWSAVPGVSRAWKRTTQPAERPQSQQSETRSEVEKNR